jgi:hypothetical protein
MSICFLTTFETGGASHLLGVLLMPAALRHSLRQQLLDPPSCVQVGQAAVGIAHEALPEGSEPQLGNGAVEQDLGADVHVGNVVLQRRYRPAQCRSVKLVYPSRTSKYENLRPEQ